VDFLAKHWGDLASFVGLAVTIWFAFRAKSAAEQARDAAQQVKDRISSLDTVAALSAAVTTLEELKGLHRIRAWDLVFNRYSSLRKHLVTIEAGLTEEQRTQIGKAISQFRIIGQRLNVRQQANNKVSWISRGSTGSSLPRSTCFRSS
jgi:hypothetical protein